jgi:choline-sulfatase
MDRTLNKIWLSCLLLMIVTHAALAQTGKSSNSKQPNYLFIAIDDLNDWIGCLGGHPQVKTPNIDRLAARGTLFTNAHTQAPLCNPSRASLLTGLRPSSTGVYALQPKLRNAASLKDAATLPQSLQRAGYRTLGVGKIFHDNLSAAELAREFDVWGEVERYKITPARKFVTTPDPIRLMDWGPFPERDSDHDDWKVADWAIERLRTKPPQPFFLPSDYGCRTCHSMRRKSGSIFIPMTI